MPLGDSITQGDGNHNTYRRPLWQKLKQANLDVDFVGTFDYQFGYGKPPNPDFDLDHQGEWGREAWAVLPKVTGYAEAVKPDVVLLHLGTNDVRSGRSVAEAIQTLGSIIDTLRAVRPSVTVLLAAIIPTDDSSHTIIQALAAEIPRLAASKSTTQSKVVFVDQNSGFDAHTDTYDGVHPNEAGEEKIAQKWYAALVPLLSGSAPAMTITQIVNAASLGSGSLAPGEIITLFGSTLASATPSSAQLDRLGRVDTALAETRVFFDGISAPLLYVSDRQINAVVPYSVRTDATVQVQVEYQGRKSNALPLATAKTAPGVFTKDASGKGQAATLNQDGMLNSSTNPAQKGEIVVVFLTGEGMTDPIGVDGKLTGDVRPKPFSPVGVRIGGLEAEVLYAGASTGQIAGLLQVNARVPTGVASGAAIPVIVNVGGVMSQSAVTLAVK